MELQIQDLVSSIKKDGIDSANKEAAAILADARKQADAMIADLEAFRKNPEVEMKFDLSDLRPEENDEPTRTIRTMPSHTVTIPVHQPERNYPRRERDEDEEPRHTGSGKRACW